MHWHWFFAPPLTLLGGLLLIVLIGCFGTLDLGTGILMALISWATIAVMCGEVVGHFL